MIKAATVLGPVWPHGARAGSDLGNDPGVSLEGIRRDVEEICSFAGRGAGTDAERRLSNRLAARLGDGGMEVVVEPIHSHPRSAAVYLLHCLLALAGGVVGVSLPVAGFAIVLVAAVSAYFDLNGRFYLLRRLLFRRASQNVYAVPPEPAAPDAERLILCANVDAPYGGGRPSLAERILAPLVRRLPWLSGTRVWFWAIALLVVPIGIRGAGVEGSGVSALQLLPMLALIVACFALGDRVLSPLRPGVEDNASGVAAVLEAQRLLAETSPRRLRIEVLLLGSGAPTMEGMRAFLRAHRSELERRRTRFLALERVGAGEPCFLIAQGPAVSMPVDARLVADCEAIIAAEGGGEVGDARVEVSKGGRAIRDGGTGAAHVARVHRYPSIAITSRPADRPTVDAIEALDLDDVAAAARFAVAVTRLVDRDLSRAAADRAGSATASGVDLADSDDP